MITFNLKPYCLFIFLPCTFVTGGSGKIAGEQGGTPWGSRRAFPGPGDLRDPEVPEAAGLKLQPAFERFPYPG